MNLTSSKLCFQLNSQLNSLQTSVLQYQRRLKQMKQALFRSRQKARRCRAPKRDVSVEYEGDEYEHDENDYY